MKTASPTIFLLWASFVSIFLIMPSCGNENINQANLIKTNIDSTNISKLNAIKLSIKNLKINKGNRQNLEMNTSALHLHIAGQPTISAENLTIDAPIVGVKDSISKLFDPDLQPCPIPEKILKKLKKFKSNNQSWVPRELASLLSGMPDKAIYLKSTALTVVLHSINVKHSNNQTESLLVVGAPTFSTINLDDWISKASNNSFGYTLDCSGLMNATIDGTATVPGDDIKTTAAASMDKKSSMFIGAGVVISPLYAAYYGDASGVKLSNQNRVAILSAILATPGVTDSDTIELLMSYEVIWASSKGQQGFNGSGDFSTHGGIGVGIAQISGSAEISGTVSRSSTFSSFDTYITGRQRLNPPGHVTGSQIQTIIHQLAAQ